MNLSELSIRRPVMVVLLSLSLVLAAFAVPLTEVAFKFGPAEYFAIMILAFTTVSTLLGSSMVRGLVSLMFGLALGLVGIDALTGQNIDNWITSQLALPFTSHRAAILADQPELNRYPTCLERLHRANGRGLPLVRRRPPQPRARGAALPGR